jgi:hypothetical protein
MDKKSGKQAVEEVEGLREVLPDLKTTPVCDNYFNFDQDRANFLCRYTIGYSRIMGSYLETKTGIA